MEEMERDELLERIRKGEQFLAREDITEKERQAAEERYCNYVALLGTMPEPEEQTEEQPQEETMKDGIQTQIDKIWRTLDPEGKRKKRGNHSA